MSWLLFLGIAAGVLLAALWKVGVLDTTAAIPADGEPSPLSPARMQPTESPIESTVTVIQEPVEDDLVLPPSSELALNELPDPAMYDRQLSPETDPVRQVAPAMQSVEKPLPAPVTVPSPAAVPAPRHEEHKQPARTSQAITAQKAHPGPVDAVTITGRKPVSPAKPRSIPAAITFGTLIVAVQPWAEIWVDGRKHGISPPLLKLQLPPGLHTVELRNPDLPSYGQKVQISTGQSVTLRHSFQ
ncbi:hypothetical protein ACKI1H_12740 [Pseudomonas sp. YH-1]|uniref:hypothetical protein n=1 Tax=Pseudomonas sp. YH-1 TaxID=3384787 RepID=UPI003F8186A1